MGSVFMSLIVFFVVILVLVVNYIKLRQKIDFLEWQMLPLSKLSDRIKELEERLEKFISPGTGDERKKTVTPPLPPVVPVEQMPPPIARPAVQEQQSPAIELKMPKSRTREEWESFIGGKLLNRIGALALIIGLGFFLKYAFDNNWISETVRVLVGGLVGLLCLGFSYRTHQKGFQIFAQGLVGAGISILYLSVYASFNFYDLVPQWVAFILMSIVTALSLVIGLYFNSLAVGMLGWAGGFLTPIMLSTGVVNETGLFTYIALLDTGLLAVVLAKKEWNIIESLTLAGTWIMYFAWYFEHYRHPDLAITVFFISVFWALFFGLDYARLRFTRTINGFQHALAGINLFLYFIMLYVLINKEHHSWMGGITILLGIVYMGTFLLLRRSGAAVDTVTIRYSLSTIALAVIATSIQFTGFKTIILWSLEISLLVWCGVYWKQRFIYLSAIVLFAFTALKFIYTRGAFAYVPIEHFMLIFNIRCLALAVMTLTFALSAWLLNNTGKQNAGLSKVFHSSWCITLFTLFTVETNDFFSWKILSQDESSIDYLQFLRILVIALVWCALSLPLIWISIKNRIVPVLISGLCILAISTCFIAVRGMVFQPIEGFRLLLNVRTAAIILTIAGMIIHYRIISLNRDVVPWLVQILKALQIAVVALVLLMFTGEIIDYFEKEIIMTGAYGGALDRLNNLRQLSLSGIWLLYSAVMMAYGFWRSLRSFRIISFVLFGFTILKIFIYDLSYLETLYRIYSFIGLGVILITVSYVYQRYKEVIFGTGKDKTV